MSIGLNRQKLRKHSAALADAVAKERSADEQLGRIDLLERALDARDADDRVSTAQAEVDKRANLQARLELEASEREALQKRRAAIVVPAADTLGPMRRLGNDLAGARGALNVGLVVTVTAEPPDRHSGEEGRDGCETRRYPVQRWKSKRMPKSTSISAISQPCVSGAGDETHNRTPKRWRFVGEAKSSHTLAAANVADLDGLSAKIAEAQALDASVKAKDVELQSLQAQIDSLIDSAQKLREALERKKACRAALGHVSLETLLPDLATLGAEPSQTLRERRQQAVERY